MCETRRGNYTDEVREFYAHEEYVDRRGDGFTVRPNWRSSTRPDADDVTHT